jgi:uroporphyrinogen decarboxylase
VSDNIIDPGAGPLTHRERFQRVMHYQPVDRIVHWEFGYLPETIQRWHKEGLPEHLNTHGEIERYFGVDSANVAPTRMGLNPGFSGQDEVIEDRGTSKIVREPNGTIKEVQGEGRTTIPHYLKMPIEDRDDWKRFKERLDPRDPERRNIDWEKIGPELDASDRPTRISLGSYFGTPRNWIGFENIALMCYDDRPLVEEIVATLAEIIYTQIEEALKHCKVDFAHGWEDICFRNGPIISPTMYREIVLPHQKRACDLLRANGCDVIYTDCDGDINGLVPLWLEAGMNCMFPIEVQSGSDPVQLRKKYGKQILLRGGLAKHEFAKGRKETLAELKRVEKVVEEGGFIPHGDHRIPDDVSYENYKYYIKEKLNMLGWKKEDIEAIEPLQST